MTKILEEGKVSFSQAVKDFYKGYFDFRGRSTRGGYWWATLAIFLAYAVLFILTGILSTGREYYESTVNPFMVVVIVLFTLSLIVPSLALSVRRLRDTGLKSKTILTIYVLYYACYGTIMMGVYSSLLNSVSTLASTYSNYSDSHIPMASMNLTNSPLIAFIFMVLSVFITVCNFLPTSMFATKSNHVLLTSIFDKKA